MILANEMLGSSDSEGIELLASKRNIYAECICHD